MSARGAWCTRLPVAVAGIVTFVLLSLPLPAAAQNIRTEPIPGGLSKGGCSWTEGDPKIDCSSAIQAEQELHRMERLALQNARIDAKAEYEIAMRNCGSDAACKRQAHEQQKERLRDIANRQTVEDARHRKQMNEITALQRHIRERRKAEGI